MRNISFVRRAFLFLFGAIVAAGLLSPNVAQAILLSGTPGGGGGGGGNMSAIITLSGTPYTYTESGGTDLGNYVGPNFTQKNIKAACSPCIPNFYVYFRQDTSGGRKEAVFGNYSSGNLGSMASPIAPANTAVNLGTYTAQIYTGGVLETGGYIGAAAVATSPAWSSGTITVPNHWFGSEWRWQSALRPILKTPSQIFSAGWMLTYGTTGLSASLKPYDNSNSYYRSPMDQADLTKHMGDTGEHSDIGLNPMYVSQWLIDPNGNHGIDDEFAMRSAGEAAHTVPQCIRNDATNGLIDFNTYPAATQHNGQGHPYIMNPATDVTSNPSGWTPDNAHFGANSMVAFEATGDRYYLEGVLFEAQEGTVLVSNTNNGTLPYATPDQDRAWAWTYRSAAYAEVALKIATSWGTLPADLDFTSMWHSIAELSTDVFYSTYANNANNYCSLLGCGPLLYGQETWESDFIPIVYYFRKKAIAAVGLSSTHLNAVTDYKAQAAIDRLSGSTGWPAAFPSPYASLWISTTAYDGRDNTFTPPGFFSSGDYPASWSAYWTTFVKYNTAKFNGYLDGATHTLHVTSMISTDPPNNIQANSGWKVASNFLPDWPLNGLTMGSQVSGTTGGVGVYNVDATKEIFTFGIDFPTSNPASINIAGGGINHGMSAGDSFYLVGGGLPSPLDQVTKYYVLAAGLTATTFEFSTSPGGTPIVLTSSRMGACYIFPDVGSSGSPVAMSVGNNGNSISVQMADHLAIDQYNNGYTAQGGYVDGGGSDQDYEYVMITQAAVAAAKNDGKSGASTAFTHADTMTGHIGIQYRWAIQP